MGLEIAAWKEYQGRALVKYDRIQIDSAKQKFCLERDVDRWKRIFKSDPSCIDKWDNAPIVAVSQEELEDARRRNSTSSDEGRAPSLTFQKRQLLCLDGQSRIRAALSSILGPGTSGFGPVHIVLNNITNSQKSHIQNKIPLHITPSGGQIYSKILDSENWEGRPLNKLLKSTLGPVNRVRRDLPTIMYDYPSGNGKAYHATLCEISIEKYLIGYILGFWNDVVSESQSRVDGLNEMKPEDFPSEVFERLQGCIPVVSEDDRMQVREVFARAGPFCRLSSKHRNALRRSIQRKSGLVPSMKLFTVHMRVLEGISVCMKDLLDIKTGKRRRGCATPLESVLRVLYTTERNACDRYRIQTLNGWRTIDAPFQDRRELSCRQLWLFVMRHDDPRDIDPNHLAYVAKQLGFYSPRIDELAMRYEVPARETTVGLESSPWRNDIPVERKERLGPKATTWLEKSRKARKYMYFDFAENFGTRAAQKHLKLENVTPLVELACIYRAFFAHPFSPSPYAEIPSLHETSCSQSQTVIHTDSERLPAPQERVRSRDSCEYESAADETMEIETVPEPDNRASSPLEYPLDSEGESEYESAIENVIPVRREDHTATRKSEGPLGGQTLGPATAGPEVRDQEMNARRASKQNVSSTVSYPPSLVTPDLRIAASAGMAPSIWSDGYSVDPTPDRRWDLEPSHETLTRSSYPTKHVGDALEWLDLDYSQHPSKKLIKPQGNVNLLPGQGKGLKASQHRNWHKLGANATGGNFAETLPVRADPSESVFVDSQLMPDEDTRKTASPPAGSGLNSVEMERGRQDGSQGHDPPGYIEPAWCQPVETDQYRRPFSHSERPIPSGIVLEPVQPGVPSGYVDTTYSDPLDDGRLDKSQDGPQGSSLGDVRHYNDCMSMFDATSFSDEGSPLQNEVLSNAGSPTRVSTAQSIPSADSIPFSALGEDHAATNSGSCLLQSRNEDNRYKGSVSSCQDEPRTPDRMLVDIDSLTSSHADKTSTPPVAFPSAHMELDDTRQEQTPSEGYEQTIPFYLQTTPTSPGIESPSSTPSREDRAGILPVSQGDVDNHDSTATTQTCRSLSTSPHSRHEAVRPFHKVTRHQSSPNEGKAASWSNWQPPTVEDVSGTQREGEDSMEGLVFHVPNCVSPDPPDERPVGSALSPLMLQPQYRGSRGDDMTPASNQASSRDDRIAAEQVMPSMDGHPQYIPSPNENDAASRSNWQPPTVENASETQGEGEDSMEGLVFHVPTIIPPDPIYERPVESALSALMVQPQYQGWGGPNVTSASNQASPNNGRVAGFGASYLPMLATVEPSPERSGIGEGLHRKRKGERLEVKNLVVKRACIESPVKERLDAASGWGMLRQHPLPMGQHNGQVDGPRSIAATQEAFAFVHGSATDRDTHTKSGPLPQQGRDQPEPPETSQMQSCCSVPRTRPSRNHARSENIPPICLDFANKPATFESTPTEPPMQRARAAPATMPTSPPPTRPIIKDWPKFSPMFGRVSSKVRDSRNQGVMNKKQTTDCPQSTTLSHSLATIPASVTAPSSFTQRPPQDVHLDRAVQEPVPTPGEMGPDIQDNMTFQTKVSPADPIYTAFTYPSSIVDILPTRPNPLPCGSGISLPGQGTLKTHFESLSKMTEIGARNLFPESDGKHRKRRRDTPDHPHSCNNEVDVRSPKAVLHCGEEKSENTRAAQVEMIGHSQHEISLTDGHKPHNKDDLQSQRQEDNVNPGFNEVPNKRICLGLDFPKSLQFALKPRQPRGFILIVELSGVSVIKVHRQTRKTVKAWFKKYFRGKHGRFFNRHLQIVELNCGKAGAIQISRFFQQEDVLVFEHLRHDPINAKSPAKKINGESPTRKANAKSPAKKIKKVIERVVTRNIDTGSPSTNLHKYNLRPRTRR
ncbi:uncharacterized protein N7506_005573 [Penicillium brevicompactum]|uniref:uncharacterized protein n=1 Tax=Penicillium brevicompactum TaxID=5074 RepID=UPI002541A6CD|nr:uncharacterized protein N7506_005573 [Penicillium brevicompactum]KAJ5335637.1 hypothetical protein N7506_005573 [Penicillium brevicompactum]